jgi:septum site-determining protein MinC
LNSSTQNPIEIKFAKMNAVAVIVHPAPFTELLETLKKRLGKSPTVYTHEAAVLNLTSWQEADFKAHGLELAAIVTAFEEAGAKLIEVRCAHPALEEQAEELGLKFEIDTETVLTAQANIGLSEEEQEPAPKEIRRTMVIDHPVRSGQKIYAQGADLVVMGQVSHGAEVIADGNVHVYGILRGRALAGAAGDTQARIVSTCFEAELVAVAGFYLTFEAGFPEENRAKPTLIYLDEATEPASLRIKPINIR